MTSTNHTTYGDKYQSHNVLWQVPIIQRTVTSTNHTTYGDKHQSYNVRWQVPITQRTVTSTNQTTYGDKYHSYNVRWQVPIIQRKGTSTNHTTYGDKYQSYNSVLRHFLQPAATLSLWRSPQLPTPCTASQSELGAANLAAWRPQFYHGIHSFGDCAKILNRLLPAFQVQALKETGDSGFIETNSFCVTQLEKGLLAVK